MVSKKLVYPKKLTPSFENSSGLTSSSQLIDTTSDNNFHIDDSTSVEYKL